jgi:hypothetical protein
MGPFSIAQVIGGIAGALGGLVIGFRLFALRKPGISWLAGQLRNLGALMITCIGSAAGQIIGHLLHRLMT